MSAALSKLEAVNIVLKGINEAPVSSLSSGLPDAEEAESCLDETSTDIQEAGWHCNKEYDVTLSRSAEASTLNHILLPANCLKVDTSGDSAATNVAEREGKLYNLDEHSYAFDSDLTVDIVYELAFQDLPYALARYIAWVAAGRYQMRKLQSQAVEAWLQKEIDDAKAKLDGAEQEADDANVFRDSRSVRAIVYRNNHRFAR